MELHTEWWYEESEANAEVHRLRAAIARAYWILRTIEHSPEATIASGCAALAVAIQASPPPASRARARTRLLPTAN